MDLPTFQELLQPGGQELLQQAVQLQPDEADFLAHFTRLSRKAPANLARAAIEIAILRRQAVIKFPDANQMYFTRPALEQASSLAISQYRANRYRSFDNLVDLGCSVGSDTLALAAIAPTIGIDLDLLRLSMAAENLRSSGLLERTCLVQADLLSKLPVLGVKNQGLFFDPGRRTASQRIFSVEDYQPRLSTILDWLPQYPNLGVKISPGVNLESIHHYPAEVEFISYQGELKEAVCWFGALKTATRRATLLPGPHTLIQNQIEDENHLGWQSISEPRSVIYEPDPAILRAGLVKHLGIQLNAYQMDADIAYLTGDEYVPNKFARAWEIECWFPFQLKRLRAELRQRKAGQVIVKKRGSPIEPDALIHQLRQTGDQIYWVFLTHLGGRPIVILSHKVINPPDLAR